MEVDLNCELDTILNIVPLLCRVELNSSKKGRTNKKITKTFRLDKNRKSFQALSLDFDQTLGIQIRKLSEMKNTKVTYSSISLQCFRENHICMCLENVWHLLFDTSRHYLADSSTVIQKLLLSNVPSHPSTALQADNTILCVLQNLMVIGLFHPLFEVLLLMENIPTDFYKSANPHGNQLIKQLTSVTRSTADSNFCLFLVQTFCIHSGRCICQKYLKI